MRAADQPRQWRALCGVCRVTGIPESVYNAGATEAWERLDAEYRRLERMAADWQAVARNLSMCFEEGPNVLHRQMLAHHLNAEKV